MMMICDDDMMMIYDDDDDDSCNLEGKLRPIYYRRAMVL
jgi:hypothetical protein